MILEVRRLAAGGHIQRGLRSIHWCPTDRTALAEAEIEYQDDPSPSIFVAFPLKSDLRGVLRDHPDVMAVAWTTTPWTLPANRGLMVAPDAAYAVVETPKGTLLVAEARVAALREAAGWASATTRALVKGRDLLGLEFSAPWGNASRVVDGTPFVSLEDGTGLVHTAPGHGKEDFTVGQKHGLEVACPVDEAGRFTAGAEPFVGRSVLEVNDDIIAWLTSRGLLLASSRFTHAYPHCWRCHQPVIFRATKQWFMIVDHQEHRQRCLDLIESAVRWDPPASQNRIRESVRSRPDWCLSRQRAWGVGIPALYCEACDDAFLDAGVMQRAASLTREHGSDAWYELPLERFTPPGLACPRCGGAGPFRKETDILDVWFDSGCTHRAAQATHPKFAEAWRRARAEGAPIVYFEGPDQHRGWFNSSLMVSVGLDRTPAYTDVLTHGWVLDAQGRAMHKSIGNVVSPLDVIAKYGAEIVRWWALATDWRNDVRIGDEILQRVADAYRKVRNTFRFLLGNLSDFDPRTDTVPFDRLTRVDRAFAGLLAARLARIQAAYERRDFHRALDDLLDLCTVHLSAVYLDVAKDRLYADSAGSLERRSAQTVLWSALHDLAIAASPALVFTAEEAWQHHPALVAERASVHLAEWPRATAGRELGEAEWPRETAGREVGEGEWEALLALRTAVNAAIEPLRAAKTVATTSEVDVEVDAEGDARARLAPYENELRGFLLVAGIRFTGDDSGTSSVEPYHARARATSHAKCDRCWTYRPDVKARADGASLCDRCVEVLDARAAGSGDQPGRSSRSSS
jgi:isoleucyl-tRNA synthetase